MCFLFLAVLNWLLDAFAIYVYNLFLSIHMLKLAILRSKISVVVVSDINIALYDLLNSLKLLYILFMIGRDLIGFKFRYV